MGCGTEAFKTASLLLFALFSRPYSRCECSENAALRSPTRSSGRPPAVGARFNSVELESTCSAADRNDDGDGNSNIPIIALYSTGMSSKFTGNSKGIGIAPPIASNPSFGGVGSKPGFRGLDPATENTRTGRLARTIDPKATSRELCSPMRIIAFHNSVAGIPTRIDPYDELRISQAIGEEVFIATSMSRPSCQ